MDRSRSPIAIDKIVLLAALYLSQGLPFGFFTQALPVMMRKEHASLEAIGLTSLLALPWALKFLWAPIVDRLYWPGIGRRRSWILPLQALTAAALFLLALAEPQGASRLLVISFFLMNLLAATQDIATDGLAVDLLDEHERGWANGVQVAGYRLGMVIGGGALLVLYEDIGWRGVFLSMGVIVALASLPVLLKREPPHTEHPSLAGAANAKIPHFLRRKGAWQVIFVISVFKLGESFASAMIKPFLADRGLGLSDIGWLIGTVGFVGGLIGALVGGAVSGVSGRRRALLLFGTIQIVAVASYALLAHVELPRQAYAVVIGLEHLGVGTATAALFTAMMDFCDVRTSATDYTVQASAVVIATGAASSASGFIASRFGYATHFDIATVVAALALLPVIFAWPRKPEVEPAALNTSSPPP
ncbi:MAG: MFS transporter [Myxococcota bacterium]